MHESRFFQNYGTFCFDLYWKYHNFERFEIHATVFLKWTDFSKYTGKETGKTHLCAVFEENTIGAYVFPSSLQKIEQTNILDTCQMIYKSEPNSVSALCALGDSGDF